MNNLILIIAILACSLLILLAISLLVLWHVLGLKDILNALGTMQGEMWDDLKDENGG